MINFCVLTLMPALTRVICIARQVKMILKGQATIYVLTTHYQLPTAIPQESGLDLLWLKCMDG